ncbi:MAG: methionine aminotransferase [Bacteroidia bacterium]
MTPPYYMEAPIISSKLPQVGTTIFTKMSAMATEYGAINLSQGFPDFQPDRELVNLVAKHMRAGHNQYAPMAGVPALREQISALTAARYGYEPDPASEITVTSGATEALYAAITAVVREGDEVIVIEPAYDSYLPAIRLNGGQPVGLPLGFPDYKLDFDKLRRLINGNTRAIILNNPHNPTGTMLSKEDLETLDKLLAGNRIFVIADEVWDHITFDGYKHQSVLAFPNLRSRSFAVFSFGKMLNATGWKLGYCIAPEGLTTEFRKVHQYLTFSSASPLQYGIADYLAEYGEKLQELSAFYQQKRNEFKLLMIDTPFHPLTCESTYFQLYHYQGLSDLPDIEFTEKLTTEIGVATIPVSVFYRNNQDDKVIRFCFAKETATLEKAADRLKGFSGF